MQSQRNASVCALFAIRALLPSSPPTLHSLHFHIALQLGNKNERDNLFHAMWALLTIALFVCGFSLTSQTFFSLRNMNDSVEKIGTVIWAKLVVLLFLNYIFNLRQQWFPYQNLDYCISWWQMILFLPDFFFHQTHCQIRFIAMAPTRARFSFNFITKFGTPHFDTHTHHLCMLESELLKIFSAPGENSLGNSKKHATNFHPQNFSFVHYTK